MFTSYQTRLLTSSSPLRKFEFFFSILPIWWSSFSRLLSSICVFLPHCLPCSVMPQQPGPWQLNETKARLRREQVQREQAASDRYRRAEGKDKVAEKSSFFNSILCLLVVCCLFLSLSVLLLSTALLKDRNKQI